MACPCTQPLCSGHYGAASENSLGNTCSGCDNWPSRTLLLALANCVDHSLRYSQPAHFVVHFGPDRLGVPQRCATSVCFWCRHRSLHSDSRDTPQCTRCSNLFACAMVAQNVRAKSEGSRWSEHIQFAASSVVIISTAGLGQRASTVDEKVNHMLDQRGQVN